MLSRSASPLHPTPPARATRRAHGALHGLAAAAVLLLAACGGADPPPGAAQAEPSSAGRSAALSAGGVGSAARALAGLGFTHAGAPVWGQTKLPVGLAQRDYRAELVVRSVNGARRWSVVAGELPAGLTLDATRGVITGRPARPGLSHVTLAVTDAQGRQTAQRFELWVDRTAGSALDEAGGQSLATGSSPARRTALAAGSGLNTASLGDLPSVVAAMPAGTWQRVNLNPFSDAWTPTDLRPIYSQAPQPPSKIILAWSSFAWDSRRGNLFLYGGGHANYRGNDTYLWRAGTRRWERASLPSEVVLNGSGVWNAIDGADRAPVSTHTYDNTVYLPVADRFLVLGGAADANGQHFLTAGPNGGVRVTGPYLFDPARADGAKVGGTTGSHVKRVAPFPEVVGGQMWQNRESWLNASAASTPPFEDFTNGCTGYATEAGRDVVYVRTAYRVYRYEIGDLANPASDRWRQVGRYFNGGSGGQGTCAFDPARGWLVSTHNDRNQPFIFWDLRDPGRENLDTLVTPADPGGTLLPLLANGSLDLSLCALDHDPVRGNFKIWCGDGRVWTLQPPDTPSATGWTITQAVSSGVVPDGSTGTGILGKWKHVPNLDVFMGLADAEQGHVWVYKPAGWVAPWGPRTNLPPTVAWTEPAEGATARVGVPFALSALASDADGTVSRVAFLANGVPVGERTAAPFSTTWVPAAVGAVSLQVQATDNAGATTVSPVRTVTVAPASPGGTSTAVLQRGQPGSGAVAETFLSGYHPGLNFGADSLLLDDVDDYAMLARFAIFQREGGPVPDGAAIQSAVLSLYKLTPYDVGYAAHRLLVPWGEAQATWRERQAGQPWAAPGAGAAGADYAATADSTASVGFDPGWLDLDVTVGVQAMSRAAVPNHGWRIRGTSGYLGALKQFATSETTGNPALRPRLTVVYTGAPAPVTNQPPAVALTSPGPGAAFTSGSPLTLAANATDSDGSVTRVEFFANGVKVGERSAAPFQLTWTPPAAGSFALTAVATDDAGLRSTAASVTISVQSAAPVSRVVTLQRGLAGASADTALSSYYPSESSGADVALMDEGEAYAPLLRFAIFESEGGPVPNGAVITAAVLSLYKDTPYDMTYAAHRLAADWSESQATWNERLPGVPWASPGASASGVDFAAQADGVGTVDFEPGWLNVPVTAGVQQMSQGAAPNFGWRLRPLSGYAQALKTFHASEHAADPGLRPRLVVAYTTTAAPGPTPVAGPSPSPAPAPAPVANVPPTVLMTAPQPASSVVLGTTLTLAASASDSDGSVARVVFFANGIPLGESTQMPPSLRWTPPAPGAYSLTAVATDQLGATRTSSPVAISVQAPSVTTGGLRGEYFAGRSLTGTPLLQRTEPVNFQWFFSAPAPVLPADDFSARWTGHLVVPTGGTWQLRTVGSDGIRLWVDGALVIDAWTQRLDTVDTSPSFNWAAGQRVNVRLEYYEGTGWATARLLWRRTGDAGFVPIPAGQLSPQPAP